MKKRKDPQLDLFVKIKRSVPKIHAWKPGKEIDLGPNEIDCLYENVCYSYHYTEGDGSEKNPLTYLSAAPVSSHYAIIDLWLLARNLLSDKTPYILIEANDFIFAVEKEGVRALDGVFTKLLPEDENIEGGLDA